MKTSTLVILVIALMLAISLTSMAESEVMNEKRQYGDGGSSSSSKSDGSSLYSLNIAQMSSIVGGIAVMFSVLF
ncbi:hypothetical protein F8M41_012340 [Gigaspora margarita]|uniref:Uncharacterized protein n=1 Tax=Gigaspora margarita TaxID=4874 RepID=A0A8H4A142_GIGMA|nr:hypothetical protein F8M41_012340 [Gigaspora margarita]